MRLLIVGDIHLGARTSIGKPGIGSQLNSRIIDQIGLLDWVLQQALDQEVDALVLTGDICEEHKPDYYLIEIFFEFLKKCEVYNLDVHIVAGNHDLRRTGQFLDSYLDLITKAEFPKAFVYKNPETIHFDKLSLTLLPYRDKRNLNCENNSDALEIIKDMVYYEVAEIPLTSVKLLVGHLCLEGSLPIGDEVDDFANELMCPPSMFSEYDYVWMGHIHKPQVRSREPYLAHIGSLDISNFGETEQQKILICFDPDEVCKFIEIPIPCRPLKKITIEVPNDAENSTEYILNQLSELDLNNAIVKLEIKLDTAVEGINRKQIEETLYQQGIHYLPIFSESRALQEVSNQVKTMDETLTPHQAVKLWADTISFPTEEDKELYLKFAAETIERNVK